MPFIPQNEHNPSAPIMGCTNADVDRQERNLTLINEVTFDTTGSPEAYGISLHQSSEVSAASLMLADLAIPYSQDDATVAVIERATNSVIDPVTGNLRQELRDAINRGCAQVSADILERSRDQRARDWLASLPAAKGE